MASYFPNMIHRKRFENMFQRLRSLISPNLTRVDSDEDMLCPISIDEIEPNLYLGGLAAAKNVPTLTKYGITHILTIDTIPLPSPAFGNSKYTNKFIQLADLPNENLLNHFEEANAFIEEGVNNGAVLVHCYFGVSRSATVVIAYIMKKYQLKYMEAYKTVQQKRSLVSPNPGFQKQLKLYEEMNYTINPDYQPYKMFRLGLAAQQARMVKILPQKFMDLIKPDPGLTQTNPEPKIYRCKMCRRVLASESNLLTHKKMKEGEICTETYFLEPLAWMNATQNTQAKLYCPKCNAKVGSYSWTMGCQCPCGVKVAPAFYLIPSKVDFTNVVKNVEMTF